MLFDFKTMCDKYNIHPIGVLHCGAADAAECPEYYKNGVRKTIWIEALPNRFDQLSKIIESYPLSVALKACLGDVDNETVTFHVANNFDSSSILELGVHKQIHPTIHYVEDIKMRTVRIDTILTEADLTDFTWVSLDLQGFELRALKGMGTLLKNFDVVYAEVNKKETYVGNALVGEVDDYLSQFGFKRVETGKWVGDCWTDAMYLK